MMPIRTSTGKSLITRQYNVAASRSETIGLSLYLHKFKSVEQVLYLSLAYENGRKLL